MSVYKIFDVMRDIKVKKDDLIIRDRKEKINDLRSNRYRRAEV